MTRPRLLALVVACLILGATSIGRAQTLQRAIYVSALDSKGLPVPSLGPNDIIVREDRTSREILDVTPAADPMEIVLLVDNSQAADQYIRDYRQALPAFIRAIEADETGAKHQVSIVTLAERPTINTDYTLDLALAIKGAERIFAIPGSGTYLLDAIIETSRGISKRTAARPVMVALTTDGQEMSDRTYAPVLETLRAAGAAFHVVVIGRQMNSDHDRSIVLDMGSKDSGGGYNTTLTGSGLTNKMKQLAAELTHQFKVTYARPRTLIPPEKISTAATRPGLTLRGTPARETDQ